MNVPLDLVGVTLPKLITAQAVELAAKKTPAAHAARSIEKRLNLPMRKNPSKRVEQRRCACSCEICRRNTYRDQIAEPAAGCSKIRPAACRRFPNAGATCPVTRLCRRAQDRPV